MKIAIDMDGTLMEFPEIYKALIDMFEKAGHVVYIVTGRKPETEREDIQRLVNMGLLKDKDHFINSGEFGFFENQMENWARRGRISVDRDEIVCMWKAKFYPEFNIAFDDAADKIRLYMDEDKADRVLLLKSPTIFNQAFTKWGRSHIISYDKERKNETATG